MLLLRFYFSMGMNTEAAGSRTVSGVITPSQMGRNSMILTGRTFQMRGCFPIEMRFVLFVCEVKQSPISVIPAWDRRLAGCSITACYREFSE